jgi:aldose 1-epimerase
MAPTVEKASYGTLPDGRQVDLFTLTNSHGMRVRLTNYGAITVGVEVPDREGRVADVTLGYDKLEDWVVNKPHFGATVGRFANRIAKGRFTLDGKTYTLATNNGPNHLHGGVVAFDKVLWEARTITGTGFANESFAGVAFSYLSKDGEEGYPGNLRVTAAYSLPNDWNQFAVVFTATTDRPTVVNLAHHSYWNLAGPLAGNVLDHELAINARTYTPVDAGLIPTGELRSVEGTPLDFRNPIPVGARIAEVPGGYDHNFVLTREGELDSVPGLGQSVPWAAQVRDLKSGRIMQVFTDQPGVQFYSGNFLDGTITGKGGVVYRKHGGLCLETQRFPDSPNHPEFPSAVLRPGETYRHVMVHSFPRDELCEFSRTNRG